MNENDVIEILRQHIEGVFPMVCSNCGLHFRSLREYLQTTRHVGNPVSYDAELDNWNPERSVGTVSLANCRCGTTLAISSEGIPPERMLQLWNWTRSEAQRRCIKIPELLRHLREEVDRRVLEAPAD